MEPSGSNIKKFVIFSQNKAFLIFRQMETLKKIPYISGNRNPKKLEYFDQLIN